MTLCLLAVPRVSLFRPFALNPPPRILSSLLHHPCDVLCHFSRCAGHRSALRIHLNDLLTECPRVLPEHVLHGLQRCCLVRELPDDSEFGIRTCKCCKSPSGACLLALNNSLHLRVNLPQSRRLLRTTLLTCFPSLLYLTSNLAVILGSLLKQCAYVVELRPNVLVRGLRHDVRMKTCGPRLTRHHTQRIRERLWTRVGHID
ncbi:hypothetical protein CALVIDRAFT_231507 [Calocera viscosa TUFC12733]|uniref:Uncharacterized protein n=1 Tax=Calocera viscosa (strain TUFC12733) TaxID=1330018 RepID=A0A167JXX6_CALVF|nr:hypothetical protein CALVIDRAFT_231507 [Calocera viscosa TUFC12733]